MLGEDQPVTAAYSRRGLQPWLGLLLTTLVLAAAAGCTSAEDGGSAAPSTSQTASSADTSASATPPALDPAPRRGQCYRLLFDEAVAPTTTRKAVPCQRRGVTARTFFVGDLDTLAQGHLLAVDSSRVQAQLAQVCPKKLAPYLGGTAEDLRLSMLKPVWFTPTVAQSDLGATWLRCDLVAVARDGQLAPLRGPLRGAMKGEWRGIYGLCGTAAPDDKRFGRVICSSEHTWSALSVVAFPGRNYPGIEPVRKAGAGCEEIARAEADDALDFRWGYEWPTPEQWGQGRTYGVCWAPSDGS